MKNKMSSQVQELNALKGKDIKHNNQHSQLKPSYISGINTMPEDYLCSLKHDCIMFTKLNQYK